MEVKPTQLRADLGGWVDEFGRENTLYDPLTIAIRDLWMVLHNNSPHIYQQH